MPKPAHTRVTFSGVFGTVAAPVEIWQCNINLGQVVFGSDAERATFATTCRNAWHNQITPIMANNVHLTRTRVAQVGADGHVTRNSVGGYNQADDVTVSTGAGTITSAGQKPLQSALAVSLHSLRAGPTGKGRIFLPWPNKQLQTTTFAMLAADGDDVATRVSALLTAIDIGVTYPAQGNDQPGGNVAVISSKGYGSIVTSVKVGLYPDTQTRRRGAVVEGYRSASVIS